MRAMFVVGTCASAQLSSAGLSSRQPRERGPFRHELKATGMSSARGRYAISLTNVPSLCDRITPMMIMQACLTYRRPITQILFSIKSLLSKGLGSRV